MNKPSHTVHVLKDMPGIKTTLDQQRAVVGTQEKKKESL